MGVPRAYKAHEPLPTRYRIKYCQLIFNFKTYIEKSFMFQSPHSPMWLLVKGKPEKAQKTLGKLRGWVSHEKCSSEFREMTAYTSLHGNNNASSNSFVYTYPSLKAKNSSSKTINRSISIPNCTGVLGAGPEDRRV